MVAVTISDSDYNRSERPFSRQCPSLRLPWSGMAESYNPFVESRALMLRRVGFLLIQLIQLVYLVFYTSFIPLSPAALPWTLSAVLFFFFLAWNLHLIVEMDGDRIVLGKRFGRVWFDCFLWGVVGTDAGLLAWTFAGRGERGYTVQALRVVWHLAIFAVAWVSTWDADREVLLV